MSSCYDLVAPLKKGQQNNIEDSNNDNENITEALNNHSAWLLVQIEIFYVMFESV